jgi:hypothetical protein
LIKFFFALAGTEVVDLLAEALLSSGSVRRYAATAEGLTIAEDVIDEWLRHREHVALICLNYWEILLLKAAESNSGAMSGNERARGNFLRCRHSSCRALRA